MSEGTPQDRRSLQEARAELFRELLRVGASVLEALPAGEPDVLAGLSADRQRVIDELVANGQALDTAAGPGAEASLVAELGALHQQLVEQGVLIDAAADGRRAAQHARLEELARGRSALGRYQQDIRNIPVFIDRKA